MCAGLVGQVGVLGSHSPFSSLKAVASKVQDGPSGYRRDDRQAEDDGGQELEHPQGRAGRLRPRHEPPEPRARGAGQRPQRHRLSAPCAVRTLCRPRNVLCVLGVVESFLQGGRGFLSRFSMTHPHLGALTAWARPGGRCCRLSSISSSFFFFKTFECLIIL